MAGLGEEGWKPAAGIGAVLAALVTGGSRGLGLKLAETLLGEGCRVAICARDAEELERARAMLAARGEVAAVACDVRDRDDVRRMVDDVTRRFGGIDLLVNNAGTIVVGPLEAVTIADFELAMATMFWGTLYPTLAVLPQMRARRAGRIVNITSVGGKISMPHLVPYGAAKFAAVGLSEGLRAELAADGVAVTTVVPGEMRTGSFRQALFTGRREAEFRWFALGATLPTTISADRAARHIVRATKRRQAELIFPWTMSLAVRAYGLAPGVGGRVLGVVNRALPEGVGAPSGPERGAEVEARVRTPMWDAVTTAGRRAAEDLNQGGPAIQREEQTSTSVPAQTAARSRRPGRRAVAVPRHRRTGRGPCARCRPGLRSSRPLTAGTAADRGETPTVTGSPDDLALRRVAASAPPNQGADPGRPRLPGGRERPRDQRSRARAQAAADEHPAAAGRRSGVDRGRAAAVRSGGALPARRNRRSQHPAEAADVVRGAGRGNPRDRRSGPAPRRSPAGAGGPGRHREIAARAARRRRSDGRLPRRGALRAPGRARRPRAGRCGGRRSGRRGDRRSDRDPPAERRALRRPPRSLPAGSARVARARQRRARGGRPAPARRPPGRLSRS